MSRRAREQSGTGIYHVMLRGTDLREIFLDDEDNEIFLELLKRYKNECKFRLFDYCLMGNHVHLLLPAIESPERNTERHHRAFIKIRQRTTMPER